MADGVELGVALWASCKEHRPLLVTDVEKALAMTTVKIPPGAKSGVPLLSP